MGISNKSLKDSDGNYKPQFETIPKVEHVSIWDFYPDPDARNMSEAEFTIQRHRLNRTQMRTLKKRPFFREESIEFAARGRRGPLRGLASAP